ncbi:dedicator of cytokinesis protein myoblast city [Lycorma delicatula]|uniref:dedicator of cytokinesis protein myoblast city n=1 Tax=Lycorma delicatula TaxID=130591 RepID=UPI003F510106
MTSSWIAVKEKDKLGVAIHNFNQEGQCRIHLTVGDCVQILRENGDWYFGFSLKNRSQCGIFPKCYIHILESVIDKSGPTEVLTLKQPQIVQELTSVLREWGVLWKHLYVTHSEHFKTLEYKMYELVGFRSKIISGTLPVDELKEIKRSATSKIDTGNKLLGLDLVVRDEQGNILNPEHTSTIQLYWQHENATERIKATSDPSNRKSTRTYTPQCSHTLFVSLRNFVCKMCEEAELLVMLYDGKECRAFTESFVVRWNRDGLGNENEQFSNLRVLFTDLGSWDLNRDKVYLVCYVVRVGSMEATKDVDSKRSGRNSVTKAPQNSIVDPVRRPFGVAVMDITLYLAGKLEADEDKQHFLPFLHCEKDNLDSTLRRFLTLKEITQKEHKGQGLFASFKMLHGDIKQVREENPHLVIGQVAFARKMGFPEVILPGDVRNDLYLTLIGGEFSKGSKSTDKNVEVTVTVCNEQGAKIPEVIFLGGGVEPQNEYRSMVYYHEDKPKWFETFKVAVPIDEFKGSHLKFTFKHRSSNEAKDKNEKPFAMSFVRLMQENGTTLRDTVHDLLVYKVDHKKYESTDVGYLSLPSTRTELIDCTKPFVAGLTLTNKDTFNIQTNVCSTKLTQNVDLLGLLNWISHPDHLQACLTALMKVDGEEIVKFLQDVLDALFNILMQNSDSDLFDNMVFDCLLYIIGLVSDHKYQHFQPVLDLYIQESFSATLAYSKLIVVIKSHVDNANSTAENILFKTMKCIQYCMRFIVRSRFLFSELYDGKGQQQFELSLRQLLQSIAAMMCYNTDSTLVVQGACLKYLPSTIPDVLTVFDSVQLSMLLMDLINKVPPGRLAKQKMMSISDIVHSQLFLDGDCRAVLLPIIMARVKEMLELHDEVELCVKILSDIMDLLFKEETGPTINDISEIMLTILRTVIQTTIRMDRENSLVGSLVAVMISIFRQMTAHHFEEYIAHFNTRTDLLDFLMEILIAFKDLVTRPVYPKDWCEMIMMQNSVILKALRFFSHTIRDEFSIEFEHQAWNNFFHCAISFLTQPALQLENFTSSKRRHIVSRYKDMRRETGFEIRSMWFNLGQYKRQFVPSLIGSFLEMTLIPETELRRATIPIFFDMMQCEFYSAKEGRADAKREPSHIKANFSEFENEMIAKLDILVEDGKGDEQYKELFQSIMMNHCENHSTMRDLGTRFVKTVTRLMEHLLEYRSIINDENKENRMSCTVSLLDFYSDINRKEMYIRYVNKLFDLHLECDNFTEAAYTLRLHSKLLNWSDTPVPPLLRSPRYVTCQTHRQLKDTLYHDIIENFDKGKMWECALSVCKELARQYEEEIFDYYQLSKLFRRMSTFYDNIMQQQRPEPEYFRVAFYGRGFPAFLQNKAFVYRGKEYERLSDFCSRTLNQFPNAELLSRLTPPSTDITESPNQYLQINKVEPVMDDRKKRLSGKAVHEQILKYYRVNDVQKFRFSRPYHKRDSGGEEGGGNTPDPSNEFATLWVERTVLVTSYPLPGILRWFPVTSADTFHISPLQNAIEAMETTNKELRALIIAHRSDATLPLPPLTMKLKGIVDAAVMGGITNYEKAFFTPEYKSNHPEESALIARLQDLIASQIPLLDVGIKVHSARAPPSQGPLQLHLEECFSDMRINVEHKYGKKTSDLKFEVVTMRRQTSGSLITNPENRLSGTSFGSSEGSGSRVSSLTRSQVTGLKSFVNFSSTGTLTRAGSGHSKSVSVPASPLKTSTGSSKKDKKRRPGRSQSKASDRESTTSWGSIASTSSNSQWYTQTDPVDTCSIITTVSPTTPVIELRQELTPKRPLRSEVEKEKRMSRPTSGQLPPRLTSCAINGSGSNRDSVGTTDSTASEEDGIPPALPQKHREADYCNLPDAEPQITVLTPIVARVRNKPPPPEPIEKDDEIPPTPPPKRPSLKPPAS